MGTTPQDNLRLDVPDVTADDNTWGGILNTLIGEFEQALTGITVIQSLTGSDHTLDVTGGTSDEARRMIITAAGGLTANINIIAPAEAKIYIIRNLTTNSFTLGIKVSGQTAVEIPQGDTLLVYCDATDFFIIKAPVSGTVAKATDCDTLITIAGADFGQKAVKNQWTKPQILLENQVTLDISGDPNFYVPLADSDTNILVKQSEMMRDTDDVKIKNPTGTPIGGQVLVITIEQRSSALASVTWGTDFVWPDNTAIDLTQTVDKVDAFSFMYNASLAKWLNFGTALNIPRS